MTFLKSGGSWQAKKSKHVTKLNEKEKNMMSMS